MADYWAEMMDAMWAGSRVGYINEKPVSKMAG